MNTGKGQVLELILEDGYRYLRVACPPALIPAPGQYLLASEGSDAPLPVSLFHTNSAPQGFIAAAPDSNTWSPGLTLHLRGPLGRGFTLPASARKVGLIASENTPARLKGLIGPALKQKAAVVLVCDSSPENLPDEVEVQPMSVLSEIVEWADYLAFDVTRENRHQMGERLGKLTPLAAAKARGESGSSEAQILIYTPAPCGGVAECGICAINLRPGWKLACKDGPVFDWRELE